ncbi:MAG: Trm112 family protein [candidate division WOR-3 bacterium]
MDPQLLEILACPVCKGDLEYNKEEQKLICNNCRLKYPIKEGIPIMLEEEAEKF